ncbi:eCIS core domain-containing protein [Actinosynnema sp. NPDC004786]
MRHDHDHRPDEGARPVVARYPEEGERTPGGLVELQRSAGNAATSRLVDDVLGGRGESLPSDVRRVAEAGYGEDFSGVRVHRDAAATRSAEEFDARAYTSGEHVVMPPGNDDLHTWLHELDHVRQQRRGAVEGTDRGDGVRVSDPSDRHERQADANAAGVLRGDHPAAPTGHASTRHAPGHAPTGQGTTGHGPVGRPGTAVQRVLSIGGTALPASPGHSPQARRVWTRVAALPAFQARSAEDQQAMEEQFWKWVEDTPGTPTGHSPWGRKQQQRNYSRIEDLEAGLHGWVAAKPERHAEKEYAAVIADDPDVELQLNSVLYRVAQMIDSLADSDDEDVRTRQRQILRELQQTTTLGPQRGNPNLPQVERPRGWYEYYLTMRGGQADPQILHNISQGVLDVVLRPTGYTFLDKIVVLHDLMEYFGDQRPWNPTGAGTGMLPAVEPELTYSTKDIRDGVRSTTPDRGRTDQGTRNEQASSTRFARRHNLPVWSGASNTTVHLLNLARWVDATTREMTALAHSIFAFWRLYYDHTSLAPHTLHEVMDVAQNFNVPYDPLNRYEGLDHDDVAAEHASLRDSVRARIDDVEQMLGELEEVWEGSDDPRLAAFLQQRSQLLTTLRTFTADFEAADTPEARRALIMRAMHAATHTDLAIKRFVRELQAGGFFDTGSGSESGSGEQ